MIQRSITDVIRSGYKSMNKEEVENEMINNPPDEILEYIKLK